MMIEHDHSVFVPGCFRCELSRDEVDDQIDMEELASEMVAALWPYWSRQGSVTASAAITKALAERDRYRRALERIREMPSTGPYTRIATEALATDQEAGR